MTCLTSDHEMLWTQPGHAAPGEGRCALEAPHSTQEQLLWVGLPRAGHVLSTSPDPLHTTQWERPLGCRTWPWTGRASITWEPGRNAASQAPSGPAESNLQFGKIPGCVWCT